MSNQRKLKLISSDSFGIPGVARFASMTNYDTKFEPRACIPHLFPELFTLLFMISHYRIINVPPPPIIPKV